MACYYHHDRESVGACKSCGKALCPECAVDLTKGLACRDRCEADVQALNEMIDRNMKLSATTTNLIETGRSTRMSSAIFRLVMGLVFVIWGLQSSDGFDFITIVGVFFLGFGAYGLFQVWDFAQKEKATQSHSKDA